MFKHLFSFLVFAGLASPTYSEQIVGSQFSFGNWQGSAYTFEDTGAFSHCVISAAYVAGNTLLFSVNRDATVSVGVAGNLGLRPGQQFPVALYVDRRSPFFGTATAMSESMAVLKLSDFEAAMTAFRKGFFLRIEALGGYTDYSLAGTFRALEEATQCALKYYKYSANASQNPGTQKDKTVLFQLSTMVISDLGIDKFRYLSESELSERSWNSAVAWVADEYQMSGLVVSTPREGSVSLRDTDASDTQFVAAECPGDYATYTRAVEVKGGATEARELRLVCNVGESQSQFFLTKFFAGDEIFYTLIKFDGTEANPESRDRSEASKNAALRAASFILQ